MPGTSEPLLNISNNPLSKKESLQAREIKNLGNTVILAGVMAFIGLLSISSEFIFDPESDKGKTAIAAVNSIAFIPAIIQALKLGRLTNESVPYLWFATMLAQATQGPAELLGDVYDIQALSIIADGLFVLGLVLSGGAMFKMVKNFNDRKNDFNAAVCFAISIALELSAMKVSGNSVIAIKAASCLGVVAAGYYVHQSGYDFIAEKKAGSPALNVGDQEVADLESNAELIAGNSVPGRTGTVVGLGDATMLSEDSARVGSASVFNPAADDPARRTAFEKARIANEAGGRRDPAARN